MLSRICLSVIGIVPGLGGISAPAMAQDVTYVEKELSRWKPTTDNDAIPTAHQKVIADDISGVWRNGNGGGFDSAQIKLYPMGVDKYRVIFTSHGCLGHWRLVRTAIYKDGALWLDRPVVEYCGKPYRRLFTVRRPQDIEFDSDGRVATSPAGIALISDEKLRWSRVQREPELNSLWMFKNKSHRVKVLTPKAPAAKKPPRRPFSVALISTR